MTVIKQLGMIWDSYFWDIPNVTIEITLYTPWTNGHRPKEIENRWPKDKAKGRKSFKQHALKGQKLIAQGNALGNNKSKTKGGPVRAKAFCFNALALTGRFGVTPLSTQGVALGYVIIGPSARTD